ncbi:hypothetical protein BJX68DRAFT_272684 [Aspergillus pseudodeflectus]|uniref:Uncharacterized protein n=1 Tax=Aspergillus pseudodeflectus TaxID=176178 RepID=A0ABR4JE81_9EURO
MPSNPPPRALLLYKDKGDGWNPFSPRAVNRARPWKHLIQVQSAELETKDEKPWTIRLGDIVTVCVPESKQSISSDDIKTDPDDDSEDDAEDDPKAYAKVSDLRSLGDGWYMVVYAWLYTRAEILADLERRAGIDQGDLDMLKEKWPSAAPFQYMLSTNRTVTLWDTAITRAPASVVSRICDSSIYVTRPSVRWIADINDPEIEWMRSIFDM